jgi:DNA recombination protein RmuC
MGLFNILFLIIGLIVGFVIAYLGFKSKQVVTNEEAVALKENQQEAQKTISRLEERNENQSIQLKETERLKKETEVRAIQSEKTEAKMNAINQNLREKLTEQKKDMQDLQKRFKEEFENLANRILEKNTKKFTQKHQENMDQLLKPLGKKMEAFKKKVEETYEKEARQNTSLKEQIKQMAELNREMTDEAKNLTKALKGDSKTQGSWGEVILQRILEKSGLTEGREYEVEEHHTLNNRRRLRPDVVVYLPDQKRIVIDSKVSLTAYERFISGSEEKKQNEALKKHVFSIRNHVKKLSQKNYQQLHGEQSPDFVLLFVPIESAFGAALQYDSSLYYEAFEQNIVIVSPSTLLATLATIDGVWKQEYQSKNAQEIAERGGRLYDKFVNFVESLQKVGERIQQSQQEYDMAMKQLTTGQGNVVRQVEMLKELGAKSSKKLPEELAKKQQEELTDYNAE